MMHKQTRCATLMLTVCSLFLPFCCAQSVRVDRVERVDPNKPPISPQQIDSVLKDGSAALIKDPGKQKCGLSIWLDTKNSSIIDKRYQNIKGKNEVEALCKSNGTLNIVRSIASCSDQGELNSTIEGCYYGSCAVVLWNDNASLNQSLFLHEYGHIKNLKHMCGDTYLMSPVLASGEVFVTDDQCDAIKGAPKPMAACDDLGPSSIVEFVSRRYIHGIPLNKAAQFESKQLDEIRVMLSDHKSEEFWPNIVTVLGVAGDEGDDQMLIRFLKQAPDATEGAYRARLGVPIALARLSNKTISDKGLNYLKKGVKPEFWQKKRIRLSANDTEEDSAQQLAKTTILSLGIVRSKKLDVQQVLKHLKAKHSKFLDDESVQQLIDGSIQYNLSLSPVK